MGNKTLDTLIADMKEILSEDVDHKCSEENLDWAAKALRDVLSTRFHKRSTGSAIRFSSLGKPSRQVWYEAHPPADVEKLTPNTYFKFLFGDVIEILLLFLAKEAGHTVTHEQHEVECDGILGHTDCIIDDIPVDAKSASPYSYGKFADGSFKFDDPFGYISQLSGYAHALRKTDGAAFLVANKVSGDFELAHIDELDIALNPPGPRIKVLKDVVASDVPPPKCYSDVAEGKSGNRKLAIGCSYCKFKDSCWADANNGQGLRKFWYSRGPVWLTHVSKEPKVDEA